ncbi:mechanosensitive ion channel family protein [Thermodesulfobacteriota bacterium]
MSRSWGYLAGVIFILMVFGDSIGNLYVAIGIAGAGITFALQEVITSIAGWVAVSFGHFFRTGDRIQFGATRGDVIDIGIFRTTLMECGDWVKADLYNGRIVRVANNFVFKEPVFNYSADFPFLWDEITVPVTFGSDRDTIRKILLQVAQEVVGDYVTYAENAWPEIVRKYKIEDSQITPMVTMVFNDNWMEYTVRYVVDYRERTATKHKISMGILEEFDKVGGQVAIASTSTDIHLIKTPPFELKYTKG